MRTDGQIGFRRARSRLRLGSPIYTRAPAYGELRNHRPHGEENNADNRLDHFYVHGDTCHQGGERLIHVARKSSVLVGLSSPPAIVPQLLLPGRQSTRSRLFLPGRQGLPASVLHRWSTAAAAHPLAAAAQHRPPRWIVAKGRWKEKSATPTVQQECGAPRSVWIRLFRWRKPCRQESLRPAGFHGWPRPSGYGISSTSSPPRQVEMLW